MAVELTDILKPKYNTDTYALLEDIYLKGGFRVVSNTTEMNNITEQRKKEGMFVYNLADKKLYTLKNNTFEIYEVSGIDEKSLYNLVESEDRTVIDLGLSFDDKTTIIPKIKNAEDLPATIDGEHEIQGLKDEFTKIEVTGYRLLDTVKTQGSDLSGAVDVNLIVDKDSFGDIRLKAEAVDFTIGDKGLEQFPIENLKNKPALILTYDTTGATPLTGDYTEILQYFHPLSDEDMKTLTEDKVMRLYQDELLINDAPTKATAIFSSAMGYPIFCLILEDTSLFNQTVKVTFNIKNRIYKPFSKYFFLQTLKKCYYEPYIIENNVPKLKFSFNSEQNGTNQLFTSRKWYEHYFTPLTEQGSTDPTITTTNGTEVSIKENATSFAAKGKILSIELSAATPIADGDEISFDKPFDLNKEISYKSQINNVQDALTVLFSKVKDKKIDKYELYQSLKSVDQSIFEVNIDIDGITTLIPKLKELEDLPYVSDKTYEFEEVAKTPFSEITLDGLTFSTVTQNPQGNQTKTADIIIKEENSEKYATASITDLEFPAWSDPGLSDTDSELQNIFTEYMMVSFGEASGKLEKGLKFSQYFKPVYYESMSAAMKSSDYNLYQTEVLINGELSKAKFLHTIYPTFMGYILVERAKVESKTVNIELKIKTKQEFTYDKYLLLYKNTQGLRDSYGLIDYLPYTIKDGKPYITGTSVNDIDQRQADKIGFVVDKENVVKYLNQVATETDIPNKIIAIEGKTLTYKLAQDPTNANLWGLELKNEDASKFAEGVYNVVFDYPFDLETNGIQKRKTENAKEAIDAALNKIEELESGAYSPELIISDDKILSTRERINKGIAIAHIGNHNAKNIDLNDVGIKYSGSKFPEFKYSLQDEYVLKTSSSTLPLVGSDLKLVKQNGKYRIVGELKDWTGIQNNMLIIPIAYIDGITEKDKFYDTVYFMQQFFNYPSQVITSDLNTVDNAKVLTSEEILIEGIEDELQLTFLTYPQLVMVIFKTDKSNFDITSANIKLSIEQATEDYFDTTLPYMTQNFMSIGKLKLEDVDGEVHIKGTITNRLDKGSPANSILISSSGAIIENYIDNMQAPEISNTTTSASNTKYNYQLSINHSNQYGNLCTLTLTGASPIQNDEVITVDIPVKKNKNVIVEKAPENVEEAIKILKDNSISGSIDGSIGILDSKLYSNEYNKRSSLIALDPEISIQGTFNSLDENIKYMDLPIFIDTEVSNKGTQFYVANYKNGYRLKGKGVLSKNTTTSIIQIIPSSYGEMDKIKAIAFNLIKPIKPADIENDINNTDGIMELQPGDSVGDFVSGKVAFVSFLGNLSLLLSGQPTGDFGDIIEFDIGVDPIWSNKVISENFTLNLVNKDGSVQLNGDIPVVKSRDESSTAKINIEFYNPYLKNYFSDGLTLGGISNTNIALYDDLDKSATTELSGTFTKSGDYKFILDLTVDGSVADNMLLSFYMDADTNETITDQERECINLAEALKVLSGKIGDAGNIIYDNDSPMPERVGGYDAGTTFDNVTLLDLLTGLLYPYQYPKFTSFTTTMKKQFKLGEGSGTSMEVTWATSNVGNIKSDSIEIKVDGSAKLNTITTNSGTETLTITEMKLDSPGTKQATAKLVNTKGTEATASITFSWVNTFYYGNSTKETLSADEIKALTSVNANSISKEITINGSGYKFIAIPKAWGVKEFNDKDSGLGISLQSPVVETNIENEFAVAQDYYVFRTNQYINGSLTFVLK